MSAAEKHPFQAEIQQLLDIVIHSLYTDREVFVRELVSNAADACEKFRFLTATGGGEVQDAGTPPAISIQADEKAGTLTFTDTGLGMTRDELIENLGTIAHSGTKAFLQRVAEQKSGAQLIGQFGVGFYSAFMVARRVTVRSRSHRPEAEGSTWTSEGGGGYELETTAGLPRGTQIVLELKEDAAEFAKASRVESVIRRYSNFVQFPIELDGKKVNAVQAIWARPRHEVKEEEYTEFYKYIGHDLEPPIYRLHFAADAPISIQALLFVPARNFETLGFTRMESEVHLYCRKVLIEPKAKGLLPEWLRFLRGVVDSEDLPLNVSRERMQDSDLMRKLNRALTNRFLKHLAEEAGKDAAAYEKFYRQYQRFLKEGVLSDYDHKEALGKLLRFESSGTEKGKLSSLTEYVARMPSEQKEIYYLLAPSRESAESSPYFEVFRARKFEVLFVSDPADEFVLDRLIEFEGKTITSAEKAQVSLEPPAEISGRLSDDEARLLANWLKETLGPRVGDVRSSQRLVDSPVVVVDQDKHMTSTMRRTLKMMGREGEDMPGPVQDLEINPGHGLVIGLEKLRKTDGTLAAKVAEQLFDNALMSAGLLDDPRPMLARLNELLQRMAPKE